MVYNVSMSEIVTYPAGVPYRTPRPRGTTAGAVLGGLLGYALTGNWGGTVAGGALGGALANQPLNLNQSIRNYFRQKGIDVVGIYRLGRYTIEVVFRYGDKAYWEIRSSAQQLENWETESLDDWLYGDLTEVQLPKKLEQINSRLNK